MKLIMEIIGYPLGWIMWLAYQFCKNYAWSIVIFTIITKIILFPISVKTQKNSVAMAAFSPKLQALQKKYANNPQKLQEAQMELYAEEGINPMSSCTPLLIQLPIIYGVLDVVYRPITHILRFSKETIAQAVEVCGNIAEFQNNASFQNRPELYLIQAVKNPAYADNFMNIPDGFYEKVKDFNNTIFGVVDLGQIPTLKPEVWNAGTVGLIIIPILSGVFQLIMSVYSNARQKKINPEAAKQTGSMNAMLYTMPLLSVWFAFSFPAGVGFYWAMSSLFSLFSTIILNKIYTPEYVEQLIEKDKKKNKNKKKSDMLERYRQMMAEQNGQSNVVPTTGKIVSSKDKDSDDENEAPVNLSKAKQKEIERKLISEKRKRIEEKYKDDFEGLTDDEIKLIEEARIRQARKYGDQI